MVGTEQDRQPPQVSARIPGDRSEANRANPVVGWKGAHTGRGPMANRQLRSCRIPIKLSGLKLDRAPSSYELKQRLRSSLFPDLRPRGNLFNPPCDLTAEVCHCVAKSGRRVHWL